MYYCRTQDGKPKETGFFLKELGVPLIKVLEAGYDVQVEQPDKLYIKYASNVQQISVSATGLQHSTTLFVWVPVLRVVAHAVCQPEWRDTQYGPSLRQQNLVHAQPQ